MITAYERHQLLLADRSRDLALIAAVIEDLLEADPTVTLLEVEMAFRDAACASYLIGGDELTVVLGMPAWRDVLHQARMTPEANRALLGSRIPRSEF